MQDWEEWKGWLAVLSMLLETPIAVASVAEEENHAYNDHKHHNKNMAYSYEEAYPTWAE